MKTLITIILWGGAFCATSLYAQKNLDLPSFEGNFVMMRSIESSNLIMSSKLIITDGRGEAWSTELGMIRTKNVETNMSTIVAALHKIKEQGYLLLNISSQTLFEGSVLITDYLFEKKAP